MVIPVSYARDVEGQFDGRRLNTRVEKLVLENEACARNGKSVKPVQPSLEPIP